MGRLFQYISKCKKLDRWKDNIYYYHIFVKQFIYIIIYVERMTEKKNEWGLERKNQNVSSNYYLWMVEFGGMLILIFLTDSFLFNLVF